MVMADGRLSRVLAWGSGVLVRLAAARRGVWGIGRGLSRTDPGENLGLTHDA
jgi:hypothetical protein